MKKLLIILMALCVVNLALAQEKKIKKEEALKRIEECKAREDAAKAEIDKIEPEVGKLRGEVEELTKKIAELEAKLAELEKAPKYWGKYTVKSGDWLAKIAGYPYVYHDPSKWPKIYEPNKDLIKDPDLIYPGWVLFLPGVDEWKVFPTDCLWKIASYLTVYGDASKWPEIYEANKDKIRDPDLIYPGQIFVIPRD